MILLLATLLMTILITVNMGDIIYNDFLIIIILTTLNMGDITYSNITYNRFYLNMTFTYNSK